MNDIQTFYSTGFDKIRTVTLDNEPWFVGEDVAEVLGYSNASKALNDHVDENDKGVTSYYTLFGKQDLVIINESGLYSLILSSKLPAAERFKKRWITNEVLLYLEKRNSGNENNGSKNSGDKNKGYCNSGDRNIGNFNSGYKNVGDRNNGDENIGNCNSGDRNIGNKNSGNNNEGYRNSGDKNDGDCNSGDRNIGDRNSGHENKGDGNSGHRNKGDGNSGDYNMTNRSSGCFNTRGSRIPFFNKPSKWTYQDWLNSEAALILYEMPLNPKEAQIWWDNLSVQEQEVIKALPNFDPEIFQEITGIDVNDNKQKAR